ncbi:DUF6266 family protein [Carboxylicivirga marina]|uniref:DUF6266 family protein n=1 Tax=Carboxylicivirga marina TaxID=2800988 RepID=UPI002592593F|nr:DUF6266 family protein [uncultured Carboxylicivirga sp.]
MGTVNSGVLKGVSGKVGDLVLYERDGKTCVRSMPGSVKKSQTPLQLNQRKKMTLVNNFLQPFTKLLKRTFADPQSGKRAYNLAKSYNLQHGTKGFGETLEMNYQTALLCKGPLSEPFDVKGSANESGLTIQWKYDSKAGSPSDTLLVIRRHKEHVWFDFLFSGAKPSDLTYHWHLGPNDKVEDYHFWVAFTDQMGEKMSNSVYVEIGD